MNDRNNPEKLAPAGLAPPASNCDGRGPRVSASSRYGDRRGWPQLSSEVAHPGGARCMTVISGGAEITAGYTAGSRVTSPNPTPPESIGGSLQEVFLPVQSISSRGHCR